MTEVYSKSTDFGGQLNTSQLQDEINADAGITTTLSYIETVDDTVNVVFASTISAGEKTTLDGLVSTHTPDNTPVIVSQSTISPKADAFKASSYMRAATHAFQPSELTLEYIKVVSYMDSSATSYDVRIRDIVNNLDIASANFTNTSEQINDLGAISNIPATETILEVDIRRNGGTGKSYAYLSSIDFYYS